MWNIISRLFTGGNTWLVVGIIVAFVALGSAVWVQTARLETAHAKVAMLADANKTLKQTIDDERKLRADANRLAKEARERAEEARREADELKRDNAKRKDVDLGPDDLDLYRRLQRYFSGEVNKDKATGE